MKPHSRYCNNTGMTLVELLVAMVIGMILLGGVYTVYIGSIRTYSMNHQLNRVQENLLFTKDLLTRDIRVAGYSGCAGGDVDNFLSDQSYAYDFSNAVSGYDAGTDIDGNPVWNPNLPNETGSPLNHNPTPGSDILVIRSVLPDGIPVVTNMPPQAATFFIPAGTSGIAQGDILMVADCNNSSAAIFQVSNYNLNGGAGNVVHNTGGAVNPGNDAHSFDYGIGAELMHVRTITYFVRSVDADGNSTEPTLYRRIGTADPEPLVEGVETMQVLYGEDTIDNDRAADIYVTPEAVTDWNNVVSVRIGLLLRSPEELMHGTIDDRTYNVNGTNITAPGDRRLRVVVNTTIGLRNRLP